MSDKNQQPPDKEQVFRSVAQAGRGAVRTLWQRRSDKSALQEPELRLLELLEEHEEYADFWEGKKEPGETENPFLHVTFHELLAKQLEADDPQGTRSALERLQAQGVDTHAAKHEIIKVLVFELHLMMTEQREFDAEGYIQKLDALGR